jgi:hypothetical protein
MASTNPDKRALDILKHEYVALRAEIRQSISKQHQITLAGYGLTVGFFGYVLQAGLSTRGTLVVVPLILVAMTMLWTTECNRMVRASYYIAYILWPSMRKYAGVVEEIGWETWIRDRKGHASDFRRRQCYLQLFVEVVVPAIVSFAALSMSLQVLQLEWVGALFVLVGILWLFLFWQVRKVSDLAAITSNGVLPAAT